MATGMNKDTDTAVSLRLGVVSDTHGQVSMTQAAVRMLEALEADVVIHCGDIGGPQIVNLFAPWPAHFVFGNTDQDLRSMRQTMQVAGKTCHERFGQLELAGRKIAFLHGDDSRLFRETVSSGQWDLVCYGHTHVAREQREGGTIVLNPGAIYRANPHSVAIVLLPELEVTIVPL